jgi:hypothetical protein
VQRVVFAVEDLKPVGSISSRHMLLSVVPSAWLLPCSLFSSSLPFLSPVFSFSSVDECAKAWLFSPLFFPVVLRLLHLGQTHFFRFSALLLPCSLFFPSPVFLSRRMCESLALFTPIFPVVLRLLDLSQMHFFQIFCLAAPLVAFFSSLLSLSPVLGRCSALLSPPSSPSWMSYAHRGLSLSLSRHFLSSPSISLFSQSV